VSTKEYQDYDNSLGCRLKKARKERGITQGVLADLLGISKSYISKIENGEKEPSDLVEKVISVWLTEEIIPCGLKTGSGGNVISGPDINHQLHKIPDAPWDFLAEAEEEENEEKELKEDDLVTMTRNVLRSNTVYSTALASNIRAFNQAVEGEKEMDSMRKSMKRMELGMDEMRSMMRQLLAKQEPEKKRAGNDN